MDNNLVYDIQEFYMTIGACNELAERGFENFEIMDEAYKEIMDKLFKKHNISLYGDNFPDNYLNAEDKLGEKFTKLMLEG